jgi:hypothetical protein
MKLMKTTTLVAAAVSLVALSAGTAEAQYTPTLSVTNNSGSVTIEWTAIQGAQGYNLRAGTSSGASNIASVVVPASITRIVVAAPAGRYFLSVAAVAAGQQGPWSNEVDLTVGGNTPGNSPGNCTPPARPSVTARVTGGSVSLNWDNIPGATYRVEYSRSPGNTELVQNTTQNGVNQYVGMTGTFYARVVAITACGSTTSEEVSFTISDLNAGGTGPRTPNPAPGTIIPRASLGYANGVINQIAAQFRGDLLSSCSNHTFLFRVVRALRQIDSRWGLNYVRGWAPRMSDDIVAYNATAGPDEGAQQIYLFDIISGHCSGGGEAAWFNDVTDFTWFGGPARDYSICANQYCARWTLEPYLRAGFADSREQ